MVIVFIVLVVGCYVNTVTNQFQNRCGLNSKYQDTKMENKELTEGIVEILEEQKALFQKTSQEMKTHIVILSKSRTPWDCITGLPLKINEVVPMSSNEANKLVYRYNEMATSKGLEYNARMEIMIQAVRLDDYLKKSIERFANSINNLREVKDII